MNLLLDTHILLWWLKDDKRLSKKARNMIRHAQEIYVSSASIWEAVIKVKLGKLTVDVDDLIEAIEEEGFLSLPITQLHAAYVFQLPDYHRDPFDKMLIAQAICEPLRFLTADETLKKYSELIELV